MTARLGHPLMCGLSAVLVPIVTFLVTLCLWRPSPPHRMGSETVFNELAMVFKPDVKDSPVGPPFQRGGEVPNGLSVSSSTRWHSR